MRSVLNRAWGVGPLAIGLCAVGVLGYSTNAQAATDEERAGARALAGSGLEACNAEQWKDCADRFERAESLIHSPVHLIYIGRARLKLGQLVEAREAFLKITREGAPAGASETIVNTVAEAERELEALGPRVPSATVQVSGQTDQKVTAFMDGREIPAALIGIARPVNPGKHEFRASAPGLISETVTIDLAEGVKKDVALVLKPDPNYKEAAPAAEATTADAGTSSSGFKMNGLTIAGLVSAGVGVGGAVVGTIFLLDSKSNSDRVTELCGGDPNSCAVDAGSPQADEIVAANDAAGSSQTIGFIGLGVGAAGLITGTVLIIMGQNQSDAPAAKLEPTIKPYFGFQSVGLTGTF